MSIARDATSGVAVSGSVTSYNVSHTCTGANRALLDQVLSNTGAAPILSVSYNGVPMTKLSTYTRSGEAFPVDQYGLAAPSTGANNITSTTGSNTNHVHVAISYTGVDQTTPFPTVATNIGNSASISHSLTVANANSWIFAGTRTGGAAVSASGTNYTRVVSNGANGLHAGDSNGGLSVGSKTVSVSVSSGAWGIALIEIKEAGAAPSINSNFLQFM